MLPAGSEDAGWGPEPRHVSSAALEAGMGMAKKEGGSKLRHLDFHHETLTSDSDLQSVRECTCAVLSHHGGGMLSPQPQEAHTEAASTPAASAGR